MRMCVVHGTSKTALKVYIARTMTIDNTPSISILSQWSILGRGQLCLLAVQYIRSLEFYAYAFPHFPPDIIVIRRRTSLSISLQLPE